MQLFSRKIISSLCFQVLKFEKGALRPSLVLGEAFVPAETNDEPDRFCKPTDVAVSKETGQIFVADGSAKLRT